MWREKILLALKNFFFFFWRTQNILFTFVIALKEHKRKFHIGCLVFSDNHVSPFRFVKMRKLRKWSCFEKFQFSQKAFSSCFTSCVFSQFSWENDLLKRWKNLTHLNTISGRKSFEIETSSEELIYTKRKKCFMELSNWIIKLGRFKTLGMHFFPCKLLNIFFSVYLKQSFDFNK